MTAVEQAWREVDDTAVQLVTAKAGVVELYERRRVAFRVLLDAGEKQAAIARRAGVTPMAIALAVGKPYSRTGK